MRYVTPDADDRGQRLDRYARKIFPGAKLGEIYEAIRTKKITIGGKKLPESTRLREGDILEIWLSDALWEIWTQEEKTSKNIQKKLDPERILYQDMHLFIYDKPSGLIVHSPDHKTEEVSLIDQIEDYLTSQGWKPAGTFDRPALAHRIDRDTSGIIITCLNRISYEHLAEQFRTRKVGKTYLALATGVPTPSEWIIHAPLKRIDEHEDTRAKVIVDTSGEKAETRYKVLIHSPSKQWSLVELSPKTGRTHQIRVHMSHIGHPLVGDRRYGWETILHFPELIHTCPELWHHHGHILHAAGIRFKNIDNKVITIESVPPWLKAVQPQKVSAPE